MWLAIDTETEYRKNWFFEFFFIASFILNIK